MSAPPSREPESFHGMVTSAPQMRAVFDLVRRAAATDTTILIRGETGTGKELIARALHALSARRNAPFRAVNCATLTGELLASELFGHVRGAFTGAVRAHEGLFAQCDGGTLFLDEIAELPLEIQPRLLRVLQERTFVPVGGTQPQHVDVRLIAATHRSLRAAVQLGTFRPDLMYRIRVALLFVPPLRQRDGDIETLAHQFVRELNARYGRQVERITPEALAAMAAYPWPGNVRELSNAIEAAFTFGATDQIGVEDLPPELRGEPPDDTTGAAEVLATPEAVERQRILQALRSSGGHRAQAAEALGMSRSTLWRRMRELGLAS
jgi:two-component system response regulator AtoC